MPVALGQSGVGALVRRSADHASEFGLDESLVDGLGGLADAVVHLRGRECVQDLQQCRLVKGHRALCPFARTIGLVSLTIARWPLCCTQLRHRGLATYTTQRDATPDSPDHTRTVGSLTVNPQTTTARNQTALTRIAAQPDLARPDSTVQSGRLA